MAANKDILLGYAEQATWEVVQSSNVHAVGYLKGYPYVFVEFGAGGRKKALYVYHVPSGAEGIFRGIAAAPSKGKAVNALLKGSFGYDQLY